MKVLVIEKKIRKMEMYEQNMSKKQNYTKAEYEYTKEEKELMDLLYKACEHDDIKVIIAILKDGCFVNEPNKDQNYAIHLIFKRKKDDIFPTIKVLVEEKKKLKL